MQNQLAIFSDGGARGNPGPAACAIVVQGDKGNPLFKKSEFLGPATNNVAEYQGLLMGLTWILENNQVNEICFYMDSELVVKQIKGLYKVKDENLKLLHQEAKIILEKIPSKIIFQHVPREKNKLADALVNEELDSHKLS